MIERFKKLAEEFLTLAEGGTPETRNSRLEQRALFARAAADCAMAAAALGVPEPINLSPDDFVLPEAVICPVGGGGHDYQHTSGGSVCRRCGHVYCVTIELSVPRGDI